MSDPYHPPALIGSVLVELRSGKPHSAHEFCHRLLALDNDDPEAVVLHADVLVREEKIEQARREAERALELAPDLPQALSLSVDIALITGDTDAARRRLQDLLERTPQFAGYARYARLVNFADDPVACELVNRRLRAISAADAPAPAEVADIHFAAGLMCDQTGAHREAFAHWRAGNEVILPQAAAAAAAHVKRLEEIRRLWERPLGEDVVARDPPSTLRPIFIVSLPRSGSTLLEQVLASHPEVVGLGERSEGMQYFEVAVNTLLSGRFPQVGPAPAVPSEEQPDTQAARKAIQQARTTCLVAWAQLIRGKPVVVLKNLASGVYLGVIKAVFPEAKIVHLRRHPLDTFLSCYAGWFETGFHYSYDTATLADYMVAWERLMRRWEDLYGADIHDLTYENLVENPEAEISRLLEFCDLPPAEQCLRFWETERTVRTLSARDVRRPLYTSSIGRWKNYRDELALPRERLDEVVAAFEAQYQLSDAEKVDR